MAELNKIQNEIINSNVGGHKFTTSLKTLQSDPNSMLGVMFSGRHPVIKQDDGSIFIDRDGTALPHDTELFKREYLIC